MSSPEDQSAIYNLILADKQKRSDLSVPVDAPIDLNQDPMAVAIQLNPRLELISKALQNTFPNLPFVLVLVTEEGEVAVTTTCIDEFDVAAEILEDAADRLKTQMDEAVPLKRVH